MKFRLVDERGHQVAIAEDFVGLKRKYGGEGRQVFAEIPAADLERDGIKSWDFGDLPETLDLERGGIRLRGFPALVDAGDGVAIRVLDSREGAEGAMREGLRRLLMLQLGSDLRYLRKNLPALNRMRLQYAKAPKPGGKDDSTPADLADELVAMILDLTFVEGQAPIRDQQTFAALFTRNRPRLMSMAGEVCSLVEGILGRYQAIRKRLADITQINWMTSVTDMTQQLDSLVFRGFLQQVPYAHLKDYPRFLKAVEARAEKLSHAAGKDQQRMREMAAIHKKWRERSAQPERRDARTVVWRRSVGCWRSCASPYSPSRSAQPIPSPSSASRGAGRSWACEPAPSHRDGRYADEPPMQPQDEDPVKRKTCDHGDQVVPLGRWSSLHGSWLAPSHGHAVQDRPDEERGEQHQVGQHAVGEQMGKGPEGNSSEHGMPDGLLDAPGHVGRKEQREGRNHQRQRQVTHSHGRQVENDRLLPRKAVTPDDKDKPGDGQDRVNPLPRLLPDPCCRPVAPA